MACATDDGMTKGKLSEPGRATRAESRHHTAHGVSPGQVIGRMSIGAVLTMALAQAAVHAWVGDDGLVARLELVLQSQVPVLLKLKYIGIFGGAFILVYGAVTIILVWFASRTAFAARYRCSRAYRRFALMFNGCVSQPSRAGPDDRLMVILLSVAFITASVFCGFAVAPVLVESPPITWPVYVVAYVLALFLLCKLVLADFVGFRTVLETWMDILPALRRVSLPIRSAESCAICTGAKRPRSAWTRAALWLRVHGKVELDELEGRSVWVVYARRHATVVSLVASLAVILGLMNEAAVPLSIGAKLLTICIVLVGLRFAITTKKSIFDGMLDAFQEGGPYRLIGAVGASLALLWNASFLGDVVFRLDGPVTHAFHAYDPNLAMLTLLTIETCVCYGGYSCFQVYRNKSPRWTPRQVVAGSVLPVAGLLVGTVQGGWYPMAILTLGTWLAAHSRLDRRRRGARRGHMAMPRARGLAKSAALNPTSDLRR